MQISSGNPSIASSTQVITLDTFKKFLETRQMETKGESEIRTIIEVSERAHAANQSIRSNFGVRYSDTNLISIWGRKVFWASRALRATWWIKIITQWQRRRARRSRPSRWTWTSRYRITSSQRRTTPTLRVTSWKAKAPSSCTVRCYSPAADAWSWIAGMATTAIQLSITDTPSRRKFRFVPLSMP